MREKHALRGDLSAGERGEPHTARHLPFTHYPAAGGELPRSALPRGRQASLPHSASAHPLQREWVIAREEGLARPCRQPRAGVKGGAGGRSCAGRGGTG